MRTVPALPGGLPAYHGAHAPGRRCDRRGRRTPRRASRRHRMDQAGRTWLKSYPPGVPADIDPARYASLAALLEESFVRFAPRIAYTCMGADLSYAQLDRASAAVASWLQAQGVKPGDRVAVMLPNTLHFPIAFAGAIRAGATVVNVNPLYTPHELEFQLRDSGAQTLFVL